MDSIQNNPFRILGLPITATEREIAKQINTLATYAEMGKSKTFDTDFPFFPPVNRTPEAIEEAKKKIEQMENKLFASLFWFWKNNAADELAFELLKEGKIDKAIEIWEKGIFANKQNVYKELIIHDNLILSSNDWSTEKDAEHSLEKMGANYIIDRKKESSTSIPVVFGNLFNDVKNWSMEVDTTWVSGVDNVGYGIIFGRNKGDYFSFDLAADGNYSYSKYVDWAYEKKISWTANPIINKNGENKIVIKKIDDLLHFYINGKPVDTFAAEPLFGKYLGFKVTNNQKVVFRNFKICKLVEDDSYGVGVPVSSQNISNVKNLSVLLLSQSVKDGVFDQPVFVKGVGLANNFFSSENIHDYAKLISGDKYVYAPEKSLPYFINDLNESMKNFIDKPKGISLGQFVQLFSEYPMEAKQYLQGRYLAVPSQNVEKAIEDCSIARRKNPEKAMRGGEGLIEKTKDDIEFLRKCSGANDVQYQIIADRLSGEIVQCGIDYFNKTKNDAECLPLYQFALSIAGSIRAKEKAKENLDSCNEFIKNKHLYNCWFCGNVPPVPAMKFSHTIYRVNSRGFRSVQFSYVPIDIPRCASCSKIHAKGNEKLTFAILGGLVAGVFLGFLVDEHFLIGGLVGTAIGWAIGATLKSGELEKAKIRSTSTSTISTYPVIAQMLREGWQMHKPSA